MPIGKPGRAVSHISQAYPDRVEVRGRDLTGDLMGRLTFTEYFHLLLTGREPTEDQRFFLDLLLVSIAEHGMMPTNVAARMTLAADPDALQAAVAAGILGAGSVVLGTSEECARLLEDAQRQVAAGAEPAAVAHDIARSVRESGEKMPGFGHPVHKPVDPRAERILELADERGVSGPHVELARRFRDGVAEVWGSELPMNVAMPIAAVMLDLGYPRRPSRQSRSSLALPACSRTWPRSRRTRSGSSWPGRPRRPSSTSHARRLMLEPEVETRPWDEQLALDDASYRAQLVVPLRAFAVLSREARRGRARIGRRCRRARRRSATCR